MAIEDHLEGMYRSRLGDDEGFRVDMWRILYREFFRRYIPAEGTFMELGAGHCELTNAVVASRRLAVDLNPATARFAGPGVEVITTTSTDLSAIGDGEVRTAFASNFFEHLSRPDIIATLAEVRRVLAPGGRLLVLQPNIRFCARDYWMFFDHVTALDDRSLTEALTVSGFAVEETITRFLPFTTKGSLPASLLLLRWYLRLRPAWRLFGQQSFLVARRPAA